MNVIGFISIYSKEVKRFLKVYNQTLISPVINALLFLAIFMLAFGQHVSFVEGLTFGEFMAPGLITMVMIQNAFANSSSSITMGKVMGHIIDFLMVPVTAIELALSISLAAATRGILVGILTAIIIYLFIPFSLHCFSILLLYFFLISFALGMVGLICGLYANSFDQMSAVTSYVITPLSFLSGTFYSVKSLPSFWYHFSHYNPFFYMIDGVRFGFTGYHEASLIIGVSYLIILNILLFLTCYFWLKKGYRIKP